MCISWKTPAPCMIFIAFFPESELHEKIGISDKINH